MHTAQIGCRTWSKRLRTWSLSCLGNPRTLMVMSHTEQVGGVLSQLSQSFKEGSGQMNPQWSLYAFVNHFFTLTCCSPYVLIRSFNLQAPNFADTASHKLLGPTLHAKSDTCVSRSKLLIDRKSILGLFAACQSAVALQRNAVGSTHLAFHFAWHDNCKGRTRYKATHTNPTFAWTNEGAKKLKKGECTD